MGAENTNQPADDLGELDDDILTFDEILDDDYYKAEFEKRVNARVQEEIAKISHSGVKGGINNMDAQAQTTTGEVQKPDDAVLPTATPEPAGDPPAEQTEAQQPPERTYEMTGEQFDTRNEVLRSVSKLVHATTKERYNAFEDAEIKAEVKQAIMSGEKPNVKELAAKVAARLTTAQQATPPEAQQTPQAPKQETTDEVTRLKAENALIKAGISLERVGAATTLFLAEGADLAKVAEFVAKYPEWQAQGGRVEFSKAPPVGAKTTPNTDTPPAMTPFEAKVAAARKKAGLD